MCPIIRKQTVEALRTNVTFGSVRESLAENDWSAVFGQNRIKDHLCTAIGGVALLSTKLVCVAIAVSLQDQCPPLLGMGGKEPRAY